MDTDENQIMVCEFNPNHKVPKHRLTAHYFNKCKDYVFALMLSSVCRNRRWPQALCSPAPTTSLTSFPQEKS